MSIGHGYGRWAWLLVSAMVALAFAFAACGDDDGDSGDEKQAIIDFVTRLNGTSGTISSQEELDFYAAHVTDSFVQTFGAESVAACLEDAAECIGEPLTNATIDPDKVEVDGDTASLVIASDDGTFGVRLIKEGDEWLANELFVPNDDIPEGTEVVDMQLVEFGFGVDLESEAVKSGDFALHVTNTGQQTHEVILVALPAEGALEDLLQDESFEPEPLLVRLPYGPGDESDVALEAPLDQGRYAFVCFFPDTTDPEGTPHAFKGMAVDFTVE